MNLEIEIQQKLKHPHIVAGHMPLFNELNVPLCFFMDFYQVNNLVITCFIYKFKQDGDLFSLVQKKRNLNEHTSLSILNQIIAALIYMHNMNIMHRDMKPENILVTFYQFIKIYS